MTHVVVQASHRAEFRVNAFLMLSRAFAADKDRHAVAANARDDDHSPSVPTGLMTPLRSDEDVACARDADISASSASGTPTSKCFVHAPADSPNGTPQENREAVLARMELVQRWPTRVELSAAEQNRAEMFSRSYEDEDDGFMLAERRNEASTVRRTLQASQSLSSMPRIDSKPPLAPKPTLSRARAYASEADLSKLVDTHDEGPVSFGPSVALMLVDIQPVYWSLAPEVQAAFPTFPENVSHLLASARDAGSHVVHVKASYTYDTCPWLKNFQRLNPGRRAYEIDPSEVEEFAQPREGETIVDKDTFGAFIHAPDLAVRLREAGVKTIVFAGLITSVCEQHSVFGACHAGYRVVVAHDACGDRSRARHEAALMLYGNYMYDVASTSELVQQTVEAKKREEVESSYKSTVAPPVVRKPPRPLSIAKPTAVHESNVADLKSKRYLVPSEYGGSPVSNLGVSLSQISLVDYVIDKRGARGGLSPVSALDLDNASL